MIRERWQKHAEKIDGYSLRERALLFAALVATVVAVFDAVLLKPQRDAERRLSIATRQQQAELEKVQAEVQRLVVARSVDPDSGARRRLAELNARIAESEAAIAAEQRKFTSPEQMRQVLEEMLARNRRVRLVDLKTLPAASIAGRKEESAQAAPAKPEATAEALIYRHAIELTVAAPYLDLLEYLSDLERLPTQMYWGKLDLMVEAYPRARLKFTVYTFSVDKAWMRV